MQLNGVFQRSTAQHNPTRLGESSPAIIPKAGAVVVCLFAVRPDIGICREILGRIDMPQHRSALKELDRGRLLFYVTFPRRRGLP